MSSSYIGSCVCKVLRSMPPQALSNERKRRTLPQPRGDEEGHLKRLLRVEARVAVRVVAVAELPALDVAAAADALGDIFARHLQVQTARHRACKVCRMMAHARIQLSVWSAFVLSLFFIESPTGTCDSRNF